MGTHRLLDVEEKEWSRLVSSLRAFMNGYREGGHSFSFLLLFVFQTNISSCSKNN